MAATICESRKSRFGCYDLGRLWARSGASPHRLRLLHDLRTHLISFAHQFVKEHCFTQGHHGTSIVNVRNLLGRKAEFLGCIRYDLRLLGALQIIGILAQGVLGGITVLTGLNPATVAAHFLLSILIIAAALSLRQRVHGITPSQISLTPLTRRISQGLLILTFLVILMGTVVTGSGPHAGDSTAERFNLDSKMMAWLHADLVIALLGTTIALLIAIRLGESEQVKEEWGGRVRLFLIVCLAQGLIGYVQYFTGLPEVIVAFHIIGSILVWLSAWNIVIRGNVLSRR